ncbi:MAG: hypothetical protein KDA94_00995 [Acidimicrobiales bacterium]|nr:hypothetical protein [Acidimicrobiales bacterium]
MVAERYTLRYPDGGGVRVPLVVMIHGGGFTTGDRDDPHLEAVASGLRAEGYATASVDYPLGTSIDAELERYVAEAGEPYRCDPSLPATGAEPADDLGGPGRPCLIYLRVIDRAHRSVRQTIAELRDRGDELGLRTDRLAVYGESAGSTVAIMLATDPGAEGGVAAIVGVASGAAVPTAGAEGVSALLVSYRDAAVHMPNLSANDQLEALEADAAGIRSAGGTAEVLVLDGDRHLPEAGTSDLRTMVAASVQMFKVAGLSPG